jgi:excisionase family DNA binding protein
MDLGKPLLTTDDVATYFNVDVVTVRRLVSRNELPAYRIGGEYRFALHDVVEFLERQRIPARDSRFEGSPPVAQRVVSTPLDFTFDDRATSAAQRLLHVAKEQARSFSHSYIGTEHLLLALVQDQQSMAGKILHALGAKYTQVRSAVEFIVGQGGAKQSGDLEYTATARKLLQLAVEEAMKLQHEQVDTSHVLLALCRGDQGVAAGALQHVGINLEEVREAVLRHLEQAEQDE